MVGEAMEQVEGDEGAQSKRAGSARTLDAWLAMRGSSDHRLVEIAQAIGVTEAELVASACGATAELGAKRLDEDWAGLLETLPALGPVNAISQNEGAVLEVAGRYENVDAPRAAMPAGRIDVRFTLDHLKFGFLLTEMTPRGARQSLQLFDEAGSSIHQVVIEQPSMARALEPLVRRCGAEPLVVTQFVPPVAAIEPSVDVEAMRAAWYDMQSPRDFGKLLETFQLTELQALELAGSELAFRVPAETLEKVLGLCVDLGVPIRAVVRNRGIRQTYVGTLNKLERIRRWLTFTGPTFRLRIRDELAESAWIVRRLYRTGPVTSLELYAATGEQLVSIGGSRDPGLRAAWSILISTFSEGADG
jgi:putative hemin transport protein